jgi:hypothetical protein
MKKITQLLISAIASILVIACNSGSPQPTPTPPAPNSSNIILQGVSGIGFNSGTGNSASPFNIESVFSTSPIIQLVYTNNGQAGADISNIVIRDPITYTKIYDTCSGYNLAGGQNSNCMVRVKLKESATGNYPFEVPTLIYKDPLFSYAQQKQFLWANSKYAYVEVSNDASNNVIGFIGIGNIINTTVNQVSTWTVNIRSNASTASNFSMSLTPLFNVLGLMPYAMTCSFVDTSGQSCQYSFTIQPSQAIYPTTITLPFSYVDVNSQAQTGSMQVTVIVNK